jgi:hypothetical protein
MLINSIRTADNKTMSEVSEKQLEANRENAKMGGVKTEEGKAISKYNAVKHGLLSEQVLMEKEDENLLLELEKQLRSELKPATEMELLLIDRIAGNIWRLKRVMGMEKRGVITSSGSLMYDADRFFRYEIMLERSIYKALHELQRLQADRKGEKVPLPVVVDLDISKEE